MDDEMMRWIMSLFSCSRPAPCPLQFRRVLFKFPSRPVSVSSTLFHSSSRAWACRRRAAGGGARAKAPRGAALLRRRCAHRGGEMALIDRLLKTMSPRTNTCTTFHQEREIWHVIRERSVHPLRGHHALSNGRRHNIARRYYAKACYVHAT